MAKTNPTTQSDSTQSDNGSPNKYFSIMLHIDDDDLDPYEYKLLGHYRKICGLSKTGECTEATKTTADNAHMSMDKVRDARTTLAEKQCIELYESEGLPLRVTLVNRMPENVQRYTGTNPYQKHEGYQKRESTPTKNTRGGLSESGADLKDSENQKTLSANAGNENSIPEIDDIPSKQLEKVRDVQAKSASKRLGLHEHLGEAYVSEDFNDSLELTPEPKPLKASPIGRTSKTPFKGSKPVETILNPKTPRRPSAIHEGQQVEMKTVAPQDEVLNAVFTYLLEYDLTNEKHRNSGMGFAMNLKGWLVEVDPDLTPDQVQEFAAKFNQTEKKFRSYNEIKFKNAFGKWLVEQDQTEELVLITCEDGSREWGYRSDTHGKR